LVIIIDYYWLLILISIGEVSRVLILISIGEVSRVFLVIGYASSAEMQLDGAGIYFTACYQ